MTSQRPLRPYRRNWRPRPLDKTVCEATRDGVSPIWEMRQRNLTNGNQTGPFVVALDPVNPMVPGGPVIISGQFQPGQFCLEFGAAVLYLQGRKGGPSCDGGGQKAEIRHVVAAQTVNLGQLVIRCRT